MSCTGTSAIRVARSPAGLLVRVEGWGTMRESPSLHEFVVECLQGDLSPLVVDLSACSYLDSTFLGCLVGLHQLFGGNDPPRFLVAANPEQRQRLLAPLQLHRVLKLIDEAPPAAGTWLTLCPTDTSTEPSSLKNDPGPAGQHILECHRRLAELGGANEAVFGPIVEQLACELQEAEQRKTQRPPRQPLRVS